MGIVQNQASGIRRPRTFISLHPRANIRYLLSLLGGKFRLGYIGHGPRHKESENKSET
jgi:hypothetical protein